MKKPSSRYMRLLSAMGVAMTLAACASIGRPTGGERDVTPPVYVRSDPEPGALNVTSERIHIYFDENVQIEDASNKVVVSPPQRNQPAVTANARRVRVELKDSLLPNTTYTIDFSDAISDLNEKNAIDGFAIDFSTGPELDTLCISGIVLEARTLEPAQGMLVGVYTDSVYADSTFTTLPFERVTKTNQSGEFTVRNLKPGTYRVFALNDLNRDYHWDRSEDMAYLDYAVTPTSERYMASDTMVTPDGRDTVITYPATRFLPNDVLLSWYNENYSSRYLVKNEREGEGKISLLFSAPADSLPRMRIVGGDLDSLDFSHYSVVEANEQLDSLTYWITDSLVIKNDSLRLATTYLYTDTLEQMSWKTDTLRFFLRGKKAAAKAEPAKNAKQLERERAQQIKRLGIPDSLASNTAYVDSVIAASVEIPTLDFKLAGSGGSQELNLGLRFESPTPVARIDTLGFHLAMEVDSNWVDLPPPRIVQTSPYNTRLYHADYTWEPKTKYRLTIDSAAVEDVYGLATKLITRDFTTKAPEDYSALFFTISGLDGRPAMVELLKSDNPAKVAPVIDNVASLEYITPGDYYARLYIDINGNGAWDTGSMRDSIQPEEVYYYPRKLTLKKNWDLDQSWDIYELPIDMQKPSQIKKNKPKKKATDNDEFMRKDEDELWDTYNEDPFFSSGNSSSSSRLTY